MKSVQQDDVRSLEYEESLAKPLAGFHPGSTRSRQRIQRLIIGLLIAIFAPLLAATLVFAAAAVA